jgi:hypothetical protein
MSLLISATRFVSSSRSRAMRSVASSPMASSLIRSDASASRVDRYCWLFLIIRSSPNHSPDSISLGRFRSIHQTSGATGEISGSRFCHQAAVFQLMWPCQMPPPIGCPHKKHDAKRSAIDNERPGGETPEDAHERPDRRECRNGCDDKADRQNGPAVHVEVDFVQLPQFLQSGESDSRDAQQE